MQKDNKPSLISLLLNFLRLGTTAFGGPAMVAYIRKMAVDEKKWVDEASFRDGVVLCQTIPGATAMQTAAYVGLRTRGIFGALVSFIGFGLPAFIIMMFFSAIYVRTHNLSIVTSVFNGLHIIVIAIIANATLSFGKTSLRNWKDAIIVTAGAAMFVVGMTPLFVILAAGLLGYLLNKNMSINRLAENSRTTYTARPFLLLLMAAACLLSLIFLLQRNYFNIAILMSKIDLMAFGGGFTSVPLMYHEIVDVRGWLDNKAFLDGIALGQVTPGPIVITATFIGYLVYGPIGGLAATIGVFLPSFLLVVGVTPYFDKIRTLSFIDKAIKGIMCSFVALLFTVTVKFALNVHWDILRGFIVLVSFLALYFKVELYWVLLVGIIVSLICL